MTHPHRTTGRTLETLGAEVEDIRRLAERARPIVIVGRVWHVHLIGCGAIAVGLIVSGAAADWIHGMPALRLGVVATGVVAALLGVLVEVLAVWRDVR